MKGIFDHSKETLVQRTRDGDRGYEVITPLYERVDKQSGDLHGIFINRGRIPYEYKDSGMHLTPPNETIAVEGVLLESEGFDKMHKRDEKNEGAAGDIGRIRINLMELLNKTDLANKDLASRLYLKSVCFTKDGKIEQHRLPKPALPSDLCYWYVSP